MATQEVVDELKDFRNWVTDQMETYERTHKTYYYPSPESIIAELDSRIEKYEDEISMQ